MKWATIVAFGCLTAAPLAAQQPASPPPARSAVAAEPSDAMSSQQLAGPRMPAELRSYRPALTHQEAPLAAAAADKTTITISTLGLILIAVLLILLLT